MLVADVSENNGVLDWQRIATTPRLVAVYVKHGEGRDYADARASYNAVGALRRGLAVGYYHFARPDRNPPEAEADHLLRRLLALPPVGLPPALDFETAGHAGAANPDEWARRFNRRIHAHLNVWPLFYSYSAFIQGLAPATPIGGGLWLANYGPNDGKTHDASAPAPWKHYLLHQFTSRGRVNGYSGYVDLSTPSARFAELAAKGV